MTDKITEKQKFLKVFPRLKLSEDLLMYAEELYVLKITKEGNAGMARIYTICNRIIPKHMIIRLEDELLRQVFRSVTRNVRILDRYHLGQDIKPEVLFNEYRDSIEDELIRYFHREYMIFKNSEFIFTSDPDRLIIIMERGGFSDYKGEELRLYFDKLFKNRFFLNVRVDCDYKDSRAGRFAEANKKALEKKVERIIAENNEASGDVMSEVPEQKMSEGASVNVSLTGEGAVLTEKLPSAKDAVKSVAKSSYSYKGKKKSAAKKLKDDDPNLIYGRNFDDESVDIRGLSEEDGNVVITGMVFSVEAKETKKRDENDNPKYVFIFYITDFISSIAVNLFLDIYQKEDLEEKIKNEMFVTLKGNVRYSQFDKDLVIQGVWGIKKANDLRRIREDTALEKRVELRAHTHMSEMESVASLKGLVENAVKWGHKAIAITDNAVVQAYPAASHVLGDLKKSGRIGKDDDIKIIFGMDAYVVEDDRRPAEHVDGQTFKDTFVVFDIETTGLSAVRDRIIEIGAVKISDGKVAGEFSAFVDPQIPIPLHIEKLTSINNMTVADAETIDVVLPRFLSFCEGSVLVAHNADFDTGVIRQKSEELGLTYDFTHIDTVRLSQFLIKGLRNYKLDTLVKHLGITLTHHHRAVDDAKATAGIFLKLLDMLEERDIKTLEELNEKGIPDKETVKKYHGYKTTLLAMTEEGKYNLYRLVSCSHLEYFDRFPKIPRSLLGKHREGILVGSGNSEGRLYEDILSGRGNEHLSTVASYYDFLEIQPTENNMHFIENDKKPVDSVDDLIKINKKIVELGEITGKPVVADGDVFMLNEDDGIYKAIVQAGKVENKKKTHESFMPPPLYFRTTDEMLKSFEYLGERKAQEVVIKNPGRIADMCEPLSPVRPDKCPPAIENSDEQLRHICDVKAHGMYGEKLPDIVEKRLETELNSIISNGYSVMYIIAQKLVWKSNDDGYVVGSRGSVGSSFVATLLGISEVNPLSPHYLCTECYYSDFYSDDVKKYRGGAGVDMPDKICPKCGKKLKKDGFDIPFETFLGFGGNKEPDIDLNFSNEYQNKAHAFVEVVFGKGQTFKAGTVGCVEDKTARGYVKDYYTGRIDSMGEDAIKRKCEIDRISLGCMGVKRTTGQHPGGIIVLPLGEEIDTFTPVQHPANKDTDIITTHFDYHSIDHNLLKLDILGHLNPTMIRMLQDLTGVAPEDIPMDSPEVMSLFMNTDALGITPDDIGGTPLGILGIPEFGTDFAIKMVVEAAPKQFSDLVRISGLSHGENVWIGNARDLIREGIADISSVICTRDDIMTYLILKGLDDRLSFDIMEKVRKGKGLTSEYEEAMREHEVPEWYIESCKKIKYMFPKAHAAAYVTMAWRIAYFKIFYPVEYYCAYYSIRADAFDYSMMAMGKEKLKLHLDEYRKRDKNSLEKTEKDKLEDMLIVEEMYARGIEFTPVDIYKAQSRKFIIENGKIMPSFKVIDKVGEKAGENIVIAASQGPFISHEDLMRRGGIGQVAVDRLVEIGALKGMAQKNQISIFDVV